MHPILAEKRTCIDNPSSRVHIARVKRRKFRGISRATACTPEAKRKKNVPARKAIAPRHVVSPNHPVAS